jgi:hypothetical protein
VSTSRVANAIAQHSQPALAPANGIDERRHASPGPLFRGLEVAALEYPPL